MVSNETGVPAVTRRNELVVFPVPVRSSITAIVPDDFAIAGAWATGVDGRRIPLGQSSRTDGQVAFNALRLGPGGYVLTVVEKNGERLNARFTKE